MESELAAQSSMVMMIFKFFLQSKEYTFFVRRLKNVAMTRSTGLDYLAKSDQPSFSALSIEPTKSVKDPKWLTHDLHANKNTTELNDDSRSLIGERRMPSRDPSIELTKDYIKNQTIINTESDLDIPSQL